MSVSGKSMTTHSSKHTAMKELDRHYEFCKHFNPIHTLFPMTF